MTGFHLRGTLVPIGEPQRCKSRAEKPPRPGSPVGPTCDACQQTEAICARRAGCCPSCTHFADLDAHGDDLNSTDTAGAA